MKKILLAIILSVCSTAFAWEFKELNEDVVVDVDAEMTISVLEFKSKTGQEVKFKPENEPYVLTSVQKQVIADEEYFITVWANGASTAMIRVFRPASSHLPICQEISDSETSSLRLKNKIIEINISKRTANKAKESWVKCFDLKSLKEEEKKK